MTTDLVRSLAAQAMKHYNANQTVEDEEILAFLEATEAAVDTLMILGPTYQHACLDLQALRRRFEGWAHARGLDT